MGRKGFVTILFFGGLIAVLTKYVYLIIPAGLTIMIAMMIHRKRIRREGEQRIIYVRNRRS